MSSSSSHKQRLNVKDAKRLLRDAYAKNPNPSAAQLNRIADEIGRSVESVTKWFEKERGSSQKAAPELVSQKNRSRERSQSTISNKGTPGSNTPKVSELPALSVLNPKRHVPAPKSGSPTAPESNSTKQPPPHKGRPQTTVVGPEAFHETLSSSTQPQPASAQVATSQTTPVEASTQPISSNTEGKEREGVFSTVNIGTEQQNVIVDQQILQDEEPPRHLALNTNSSPVAFEGVTKLQHELHCAMHMYYQASQGLPMTLPDSLSSK